MSCRRVHMSSAYPKPSHTHWQSKHDRKHRTIAKSWSLQPASPRAPAPKRDSHASKPAHQAKAQSQIKQQLRQRQTRTVPAIPAQAPRRREDKCRADLMLRTNLGRRSRARTSPPSGIRPSRRSEWLQQTTDRFQAHTKHRSAGTEIIALARRSAPVRSPQERKNTSDVRSRRAYLDPPQASKREHNTRHPRLCWRSTQEDRSSGDSAASADS